jgi:hypothetical protein
MTNEGTISEENIVIETIDKMKVFDQQNSLPPYAIKLNEGVKW